MGKGGCCLMTGIVVRSTTGTVVSVGPGVGVTAGLTGVPWDWDEVVGVAVDVAVTVAGTGAVLVSVGLPARDRARRSPGSDCPAKTMVPRDRSR